MMTFGVAQSLYFITYNIYFERYFIALPFFVTGVLSGLILYFFCPLQRRKARTASVSAYAWLFAYAVFRCY